jgi:hypothetical protein
MTYASRTGQFADVSSGFISNDLVLVPQYGATDVIIEAAVPGDFDLNGAVTAFDLLTWQNGFGAGGTTYGEGDADLDGDVDAFDLLIWQENFGSAAAAVPEPSALFLLVTGALAVVLFVGRRRR